MSGDLVSPFGERRGDPSTSANAHRTKGKAMNFATGWPDPSVAVALAPVIHAVVKDLARRVGANRIVSEIGPWILADRRRRAKARQ